MNTSKIFTTSLFWLVLIEHHALKGLKLAVRKNLESILIFVGIIYKNKGKYFKKIKYKKDKEINYEKKEV